MGATAIADLQDRLATGLFINRYEFGQAI